MSSGGRSKNACRFRRDAEAAAVTAPGAELGRGGVQLESAAVDGQGREYTGSLGKKPWAETSTLPGEQLLCQLR